MSLISLRNLAGPFKSKFQMGGLAIAIILVLVIRLGLSRNSDRADLREGAPSEDSDDLRGVLNDARKTKQRQPPQARDDVLEGLIDQGIEQDAPEEPEKPAKGESFDDIRRSLGLD
ncbi:MAG: hypothetical protein ACK5GN_05715 [Pseudomonadota bacterium]|jgi:hypothetical protein